MQCGACEEAQRVLCVCVYVLACVATYFSLHGGIALRVSCLACAVALRRVCVCVYTLARPARSRFAVNNGGVCRCRSRFWRRAFSRSQAHYDKRFGLTLQ